MPDRTVIHRLCVRHAPGCAAIATALLLSLPVHAQDAELPAAPAKLAMGLPTAAWGDVTRLAPVLESQTTPFKRSQAKVTFEGPRRSKEPFMAIFSITDEGAYNARMYAYGANWLKEDVKSDSQHSVKLPGGRRALYTNFTVDSMEFETFVANRLVVRTHCINSDEVQCLAAFQKFDFKAIEALKP